MRDIILATSNRGKAAEIGALLSDLEIRIISLHEYFSPLPEIPETGSSFDENALQKALWVKERVDCPVLADDSGLEVDVLNGAPGIYSARFAGADCTDNDNVVKLLDQLNGVAASHRTARFRCVLVLLGVAPQPLYATGVCDGIIAEAPSGTGGFGYDPLFIPAGFHQTFAQMEPTLKDAISHRGKAVMHLRKELVKLYGKRSK